jgi:hypothetical protein
MGTNVYCTKILDQKIKDKIIKEFQKAETLPEFSEYIESLKYKDPANFTPSELSEIHVGKRSSGWKFCYSTDLLQFCKADWKSIYEFLSRLDIQLYNEYGEILTPEQFKKEYASFCKDGWTNETYFEKHPEEAKYWNPEDDIYAGDLWFVDGYFC